MFFKRFRRRSRLPAPASRIDLDSFASTKQTIIDAEKRKLSYQDVCQWWSSASGKIGGDYPQVLLDHDFVLRLILLFLSDRKPKRCLDLGAGSGRMAKILLDHFSDLHVTLVDLSANLLREAQSELQCYSNQTEYVQADFFSAEFQPEPERYDCVISALALHHGQGAAMYRDIYQEIEASLVKGGVFLCWDHVKGADMDLETINFEMWKNHIAEAGVKGDLLERMTASLVQDNPLTSFEYLNLLSACNFSAVDILWKKGNMILYVAIK